MLRSVFTKTLYDARKMLLWWSLALTGTMLVYVAGHKQYVEAGFLEAEMPEFLGAFMGKLDFASGAGYLNATIYTLLGSVLVVIFALMLGARAIAGDEESGMLDVLLAHPVSRTRFVLERFAALALAVGVIGFVMWAAVSAASRFSEMDVPIVNIAAATAGLTLLGIVIGSLALAVGALTGRQALAAGVTAFIALAAFLANNLAPMFEGLEFVQRLSPFYYYLGGDPLREGFDVGGLAVLTAAALVLAGLAVWGLNRRDIAV
ncbi:MAG: ABC transporter permease subunit [Coriobacteriia bacterium]|nr:ABC transporter permease subunit [Coriobacteriia bacterium]